MTINLFEQGYSKSVELTCRCFCINRTIAKLFFQFQHIGKEFIRTGGFRLWQRRAIR